MKYAPTGVVASRKMFVIPQAHLLVVDLINDAQILAAAIYLTLTQMAHVIQSGVRQTEFVVGLSAVLNIGAVQYQKSVCVPPLEVDKLGQGEYTMAKVNVSLWFDNLTLGPGESGTFFEDNVSQENVRWFTAIPVNTLIDDFEFQDQLIEVTQVFHILKGKNHDLDGTGGRGTVQVNVTVQNLDAEKSVTFNIFKAETQ